ncbi:hypothetical protein CDIK_3539 [Cucumispora dikerogammari]|nr:hypothetical protein CDIK_3539 [Cucumispora dikerogammari]
MFIRRLFSTSSRISVKDKYDQLKDQICRTTNVIRSMVGLDTLERKTKLDESAQEFTDYLIDCNIRHTDIYCNPNIMQYENNNESIKHCDKNTFTENISKEESVGKMAIEYWQKDTKSVHRLLSPSHRYVGVGIGVGQRTKKNYTSIEGADDQLLEEDIYIVQQYEATGLQGKFRPTISVTQEMNDYLKDYVECFSTDLNALISKLVLLDGGGNDVVVENDYFLNGIAGIELETARMELFNDVSLKSCQDQKLLHSDCTYNKWGVVFKYQFYVPEKDFFETFQNTLATRKELYDLNGIHVFGISVQLFEDKTFYISLVFDRSEGDVSDLSSLFEHS